MSVIPQGPIAVCIESYLFHCILAWLLVHIFLTSRHFTHPKSSRFSSLQRDNCRNSFHPARVICRNIKRFAGYDRRVLLLLTKRFIARYRWVRGMLLYFLACNMYRARYCFLVFDAYVAFFQNAFFVNSVNANNKYVCNRETIPVGASRELYPKTATTIRVSKILRYKSITSSN